MGSPQIKIAFRFISETVATEELVKALPLPPDGKWSIGELRGRTIIKEVNNGIEYRSQITGSGTLNSELNKLLLRAAPLLSAVKSLPLSCKKHLSCVIYSANIPELFLDETVITHLAEYKASLDIDLYQFDVDDTETPRSIR